MIRKLVIGLTGGIATGKSLVLKEFKKLGANTIDCDILAKSAVEMGRPSYKKIARKFGTNVLNADGSLNRAKLGGIVFKSPKKRKILEKIVHPEVKKQVLKKVRAVKRGVIVVDVPLLFEAGWQGLFDEIVLVYSPRKVQVQRLLKRKKISKAEAFRRVKSQISIEKKRKMADCVLDNTCDFSHVRDQVDGLYQRWISTVTPGPW